MLVVETIAKMRRAFFGQGKAIKAICRELGLSPKVVRKVIRSGATEFRYEREHLHLPKIGPWRERLDAMLLANAAKDTDVSKCEAASRHECPASTYATTRSRRSFDKGCGMTIHLRKP